MAEIANLVVKYSADTKDAEAGAERVNSGIGKAGKAAMLLGAAAGVAVAGFFAKSIGAAANFEQGMSGVAASLGGVGTASGITEAQFSALNEEALRIGETTSVGATDAAMAMELLAKAGVSTESIINGTAQAVINVSEATGESVNQSASSLGSLSNLFADTGISGAEMADVIVSAMNASDATLSEFQTGVANLAPVVAGTGMEFGEAAGLISFFNAQGMAAAKVGSSLTSAYLNLINPTTDMVAAQQALGVSVYDAQGQFRGFPAILDDVRTATEGMTDQQRDAWITQLFGAEALDVVTLALEAQEGALEDHIGAMDESGTAATAAATRMDNLKGDIEGLQGAFETLSIRVGGVFLPRLRSIVQGLTDGMVAVGNFTESVIGLMDQGLNPVEAVFRVLGNRLIELGGGQGIIAELGRGFQRLGDFAHGMGLALDDVVDAFQDFARGDFAGGFRELGEAANTAWDAISQLASTTLNWVIDTAVPAITGWIVDNAGDIWGGIKTIVGAVFDGIVATIAWTVSVGVPTVIGGITSIAGRVGDWLKGYLLSGLSQTGDGTGGPDPFGTGGSLTATIGAWAVHVGVPQVVGAITSIAGRLGDWLRSYLYGGGSGPAGTGSGAGSAFGGAGGGITVEIAQILIDVLDAVANISTSDVQEWVQTSIDEAGAIEVYIKRVNALVQPGATETTGPDKGEVEKSLVDRFLSWGPFNTRIGQILVSDATAVLTFDLTRLPDMILTKLEQISSAGFNTSLADWTLQVLPPFYEFAVDLKTQVMKDIKEQLGGLSVPSIPWSADFDFPEMTIPGDADFITDIQETLSGLPVDAIEWAASFEMPDITLPSTSDIIAAIKEKVGDLSIPFDWSIDLGGGNNRVGADRTGAGDRNDMSSLGGSLTSLRAQVDAAVGAITASLGRVGSTFQSTAAMVQSSTTQMASIVRTQFTVMQTASNASVTQLSAMVRAQFTAMQAAVNAAMSAMSAQVRSQFTALAAAATASANQMRSSVQAAMQGMSAAASAAMASFSAAVRSGFQQAVAAAQSGVAGIRGAVNSLGSLYSQGFSVGASLGQGVAAGLYSQVGAVAAAAAALVSAANAAAQARGQIASPSRLMAREIGVPLGQGIAVGMESQRNNIASTFASLIPSSGGSFGRGLSVNGAAYAGRGGGSVQNITIYALRSDEYQKLIDGAEGGREYKRNRRPVARLANLGTAGVG